MSGNQGWMIVLFSFFALVTLGITLRAGRRVGSPTEFFAGSREFTPLQNGLALTGDYLSAASFLGMPGMIALFGYDGMLYAVGFLVAWLVVLMLTAELVRNSGRFTFADVLAVRMRERPVRAAAGTSSIVVALFYLLAQMVGAGTLVSLLLGGDSEAVKRWTIVAVGALMIVYVAIGGMRGTTWIGIVKAVVLLAGTAALCIMVLVHYGGDIGALLRASADHSGQGLRFLSPGLKYGESVASRLDFVSLGIALVLGTAGLPHILSRFYTVPTARAARRSTLWAIGLIGAFYLMGIVLGFGAAALVGSDTVRKSNEAGNTAVPLLARALGEGAGPATGSVLFVVISALAFATILAVVAGLTLASSASFAHDLWAVVVRRGKASGGEEVRSARIAACVIGATAIALSLFATKLNVAFLVGLAFAVAASANLPALLYTLFWRRFTTRGTVWAIWGGLVPALLLVFFSPVMTGGPKALIPGIDLAWFPLENPGIVSIPMGFVMGWLGTVTDRERSDDGRQAELEVRSLTGAGAV